MTQEEILEGNKLIAEFMGFAYLDDFNYPEQNEVGWYNSEGDCCGKELYFHSSWDWLMPVVEKIENIDIRNNKHDFPKVKLNGDSCEIFAYATFRGTTYYWKKWMDISGNFHEHKTHCESKLEAIYKAVIEFIQWYNQQSKL